MVFFVSKDWDEYVRSISFSHTTKQSFIMCNQRSFDSLAIHNVVKVLYTWPYVTLQMHVRLMISSFECKIQMKGRFMIWCYERNVLFYTKSSSSMSGIFTMHGLREQIIFYWLLSCYQITISSDCWKYEKYMACQL